MGGSIKIFTFRDIDVKVHITFVFILLWAAFQWGANRNAGVLGAVYGVTLILLLFALVTMHEFGHALAAQRYGIPTHDITLWPFGGLARLERIPRNPLQEFVIALAGPAVNIVAALVLGIVALAALQSQGLLSGAGLLTALRAYTFTGLVVQLTLMNISLAVFNLLPAFPMDGGRVLRALLAMVLPYRRATAIAMRVGQGFALLMIVFGLLNSNLMLAIIGFFIFGGAAQEGAMVRAGSEARGRSGTMARGRFITFSPDGSVYEVYNWSGEGPPTQHEIDTLYRRLQLRPGEQQEP